MRRCPFCTLLGAVSALHLPLRSASPTRRGDVTLSLEFVPFLDESGALSVSNIGKDIVLSDVYGLPAAFGYLAWKYATNGSLMGAWPPSYAETAAWLIAVAIASSSSRWLPALLQLRGGALTAAAAIRPTIGSALARRPRAPSTSMDLFKNFLEEDDEDEFGVEYGFGGRDYDFPGGLDFNVDGPLDASERDVLYAWPALFGLASFVFVALKGVPFIPDNMQPLSFWPVALVLWLTWPTPPLA